MKINRALGLALVIIILRILVPPIFHAAEDAIVTFFHTSNTTFEVMQANVLKAGLKISVPEIK